MEREVLVRVAPDSFDRKKQRHTLLFSFYSMSRGLGVSGSVYHLE